MTKGREPLLADAASVVSNPAGNHATSALRSGPREGYDCDYRALRVADLFDSQGIWLVSSMTLAARVHTLDGRRLPRTPIAEVFAELVDAAIVSDR